MYGRGNILRIDLTTGSVSHEPIPTHICRKYIGGEGINSWLLWQHFLKVDPRIDPLSPDNVLVAGIGPLGATGLGGGTKMKWTFKSPAYHIFGDSTCGGRFPGAMRWAGYDHIVITGRASQPVIIVIKDEQVEIQDAQRFWGKDAFAAHDMIRDYLADKEFEVAGIGPAGENLVTYASIISSRHRVAGRTGGGAVMGSKNLKAIAIRGFKGIPIYDRQAFFKAIDAVWAAHEKIARVRDGQKIYGTLRATTFYQRLGGNAYRNDQVARLPEDRADKLSHHWYFQNMQSSFDTCSPGCTWGCDGRFRIKGNESPEARKLAGFSGYKPEYLAVASLGIMTDIADMPAVAYLNEKMRKYGMDLMEVGACAGMLMELWQRGIITDRDTAEWVGQPLSLEWGSVQAVEKIIDSIALQDNKLGNLLKEGVYRAALKLEEIKEGPVRKYVLYGKGGSPFNEELRHFPSWIVNMAVASRGADHLKGSGTMDKGNRPDWGQYFFGDPRAAEPNSTHLKGAGSAVCEDFTAIMNCLGVCNSPMWDPVNIPVELLAEALRAATDTPINAQEIISAGRRTVNLEKAFNSRLGLRREDDMLCERWLKEAEQEGPGKGWKAEDFFEKLKDEYYSSHGWDPRTSLQTRETLEKLDMKDVAEVLEQEGSLA